MDRSCDPFPFRYSRIRFDDDVLWRADYTLDFMQTSTSMEKQDSYIALASLLGFFIDLFRHFPQSVIDFCYRLLCAAFGYLIFAPYVAEGCTWVSSQFSWLGFMNAEPGRASVPLIYCICLMFAEPTVTFLSTFVENDLPTFLKRRFRNGDTQTKTKQPRRERETDSRGI
jgi:hypothetical protein